MMLPVWRAMPEGFITQLSAGHWLLLRRTSSGWQPELLSPGGQVELLPPVPYCPGAPLVLPGHPEQAPEQPW